MRKIASLLTVLLCSTAFVFAQSHVTGKVTDSKDGTPLSSVSVKVKGSTVGTSTKPDGTFSLNVATNEVTLEISGVGYLTKSIKAAAGDNVSVSLDKDTKSLSGVVVTALGIRRSEKALGYAVSKVDPSILLQKSEPDVLKSLEGQVAGVSIQQSEGTPGAATRITIRGNATFFGDAQPLFIVDGVPFSNDQITTTNQEAGGGAYSSGISDLDPNDIASMNVLKGSAASALYGSRAANGVIIITTKSGSAARSRKGMEVTYSTSYSLEKISNLPEFQNLFGEGAYDVLGTGSNGSWGAPFISNGGTIDSIGLYPGYAGLPGVKGDSLPYRPYPNNVSDLFRTGNVAENSVSFSGGDEKTAFSSTLSYLNNDGYVRNSNFNRANMSFGGSTKLDNGLTVQGNFSYSKSNQLGGLFGEAQVGAPTSFARTLLLPRSWDLTGLPFQTAAGGSLIPNQGRGFDNPYWAYIHNTATTLESRTIAGVHLNYNIKKWLRLDYQIGSNSMNLSRKEVIDHGSVVLPTGSITEEDFTDEQIESNFIITATPDIGKDLSLKILAGQDISQVTTTDLVNLGDNIIISGVYSIHNTATQSNNIDQYTRHRLEGLYGEVTLGYKSYAFLDFTGRNDQSSTLSTSKSSYFYPGVSGSFVFTDAFKLQGSVLDFGKIRAGWAKVGADAGPYLTKNTYTLNPTISGQLSVSSPLTSANPDIGPEFTSETELGTQLSFFKRRISLDFTWYDKNTDLLISPATTAASTGYTALIENLGKINNQGVEVDLGITPIQSKSFSWNIHTTFTHNKNVVLSLTEGLTKLPLSTVATGSNPISPYIEVGKPIGFFYGSQSARDSKGNLLIDPATGLIITSNTLGDIGDPNPDYKLGLDNTFTYKGITLDFLFDYTKGGSVYSESITNELGRGVTQDTKDRETTWAIKGVYGNPTTDQPIVDASGKEIANTVRIPTEDVYFSSISNEGSFATNAASEWNVYDATVWHLREVTLGYQIPKNVFKRIPFIGSATLSLTGRNLWYYAPGVPKYTNFDPEQNSFGATATQGFEISAAPTSKRYGINLKVSF